MARPRTCSVKYFCLGAVLIFLGSVLLCALGFTVVLPHEATKLWPEVTCHVLNATFDEKQCACDQQVMEYDNCLEKYPCLKVSVILDIRSERVVELFQGDGDNTSNLTSLKTKLVDFLKSKQNRVQPGGATSPSAKIQNQPEADNATTDGCHGNNRKGALDRSDNGEIKKLKTASSSDDVRNKSSDVQDYVIRPPETHAIDDDFRFDPETLKEQEKIHFPANLYRQWSDSFHKTCALYECGDELWNVKEVKRFHRDWGQRGQSFACYFDPEFPDVAVIERTPRSHAVHAILWPALSLFTGSLIWMGMCLGCWKIEIEQPQASSAYYRGIL